MVGSGLKHMVDIRGWKNMERGSQRPERIWSSDLSSLERENALLSEHTPSFAVFYDCLGWRWGSRQEKLELVALSEVEHAGILPSTVFCITVVFDSEANVKPVLSKASF